MTTPHSDNRIAVRQLLIPVSLLSLAVFLFLAFHTMQLMRDRDALNNAKGQQEQAFQESQRLQAQLNALLIGTQELADKGNKSAKGITDKLRDIGINIRPPASPQAQGAIPPAPVPVANGPQGQGAVKP